VDRSKSIYMLFLWEERGERTEKMKYLHDSLRRWCYSTEKSNYHENLTDINPELTRLLMEDGVNKTTNGRY